jgi:hypothetical protein
LCLGQHLVEWTAPFRLEALADRGAAATELGVPKLGVVQLVAMGQRLAPGVVERVLDVGHCLVGGSHTGNYLRPLLAPPPAAALVG